MKNKKIFCAVLIFCCLCSASPAAFADKRDTISNLKNGFMVLYNSEWKAANFNYRLFRILDKEFEDNINSMMLGTSGVQLAVNYGKVIEKILDNTFAIFQPEYELFFKDFYDKYYTYLEASPIHFSREKLKTLFLYEEIASLQLFELQKTLDNAAVKLKKEFPMPNISILAVVIGILIILLRGLLTRNFDAKNHRKALRVNIIAVFVGIVIMVLGAVQISRWLLLTQGFTRDFLYEETKNLYVSELPEAYWNFMKPYIEEALN